MRFLKEEIVRTARLGCTLHTRQSAAGVIEMGETAVHVVTFLWDQKGKFWPAMEWAVNTFLTHGEILITTGILPAEFQYIDGACPAVLIIYENEKNQQNFQSAKSCQS